MGQQRTAHLALVAMAAAFMLGIMNMGIGTMHPALHEDHQVIVKSLETFVIDKNRQPKTKTTIQQQPKGTSLSLVPAVQAAFPREPVPRPPLNTIIQGWNVTSDPSWLMNFAILGFPKCGTSTMMHSLSNHSQIQIFADERCELGSNQQVPLIKDLYNELEAGDYVRGIKCPMALENTELSMRNFQRFFPRANYIVGIRHPILWFESFYNFRIHNKFGMPPINELIGRCRRKSFAVCTFRANFHLFLSNLGKTNTSDPEELQWISTTIRRSMDRIPTTQKIFLYDIRQLSDPDPVREAQLLVDLQGFLGLTEPIEPMLWFKPGKKHASKVLDEVNQMKIDICDDQYSALRQVLMETAVNASTWITNYFIDAPDVVVTSKDYFANVLMKSWHEDPCLERANKKLT